MTDIREDDTLMKYLTGKPAFELPPLLQNLAGPPRDYAAVALKEAEHLYEYLWQAAVYGTRSVDEAKPEIVKILAKFIEEHCE